MACEPPRGTGQPFSWAATAKSSAMPPVARPLAGAMAWAASPANRPRAFAPRNRRARSVAGWIASSPNRTQRYGSRGSPIHGVRRKSSASVSQWPRYGASSLRYAPASCGPSDMALSPTEPVSTAAEPSGKG